MRMVCGRPLETCVVVLGEPCACVACGNPHVCGCVCWAGVVPVCNAGYTSCACVCSRMPWRLKFVLSAPHLGLESIIISHDLEVVDAADLKRGLSDTEVDFSAMRGFVDEMLSDINGHNLAGLPRTATYVDEEGDKCTLTSEANWRNASHSGTRNLRVFLDVAAPAAPALAASKSPTKKRQRSHMS